MPLRGRNDAVSRVTSYLQDWLPWTLRQVTVPDGMAAGWLPDVASWTRPVSAELPPDDTFPLVVVSSPAGRRHRETRGAPAEGIYDLVVTAVVRGHDWEHTGLLVGGYGAALVSLLDRRDLPDDTWLTEVTSERYGPAFDRRNGRTLAEVVIGCTTVIGAVDELLWPDSAPTPDTPAVPVGTVETIHVTPRIQE